jgi:hypothetical protein
MASPEMRSRLWVGLHDKLKWVHPQEPVMPHRLTNLMAISSRFANLHVEHPPRMLYSKPRLLDGTRGS